jgi:DNA (cytosine-5)-methyltransferase 1
MLRAIREIAPTYVVGENVSGIINWNNGLVFHEVQSDLENEGYEVQPFVLPACAVNAPHRRDRVWFIAYSHENRRRARRSGCEWEKENTPIGRNILLQPERFGKIGITSNSLRFGLEHSKHEGESRCKKGDIKGVCCNWAITNTEGKQSERFELGGQREVSQQEQGQLGGIYSETLTANSRLFGQEKQKQQTVRAFQCSNFETFPTQPPVCSGNDGISSRLDGITFPKWRKESVQAFGNAVVPQLVMKLFSAINEHERLLRTLNTNSKN